MVKAQKFHLGIKALIKNRGKVLVVKDTGRYPGFDLPGGKIDEGESLEKALKRELLEEVGLKKFKQGKLLYVYEREDYKKNGINLMLIFYEVVAANFKVKISDEHSDFKWISKVDFIKMLKNQEFRNKGVETAIREVLK